MKLLLLLVGLGIYGTQTLAAEHHHGLEERTSCPACVLHETPLVAPQASAEPLPPEPPPAVVPLRHGMAPPPALEPADVSPSTSPPAPAQRA